MEPETAAELAALDTALSGEPVDPEHAELAELAVLVAAERPQIDTAFAAELDERVTHGFAGAARPRRRRRRVWVLSGVATAVAGALVALVVVASSPSPAPRLTTTAAPPSTATPANRASPGARTTTTPSSGASSASGAAALAPQAAPGGRKIVQSAQLSLTTTPGRIEDVAGQVFEVVRVERGFVGQSTVTATGGSDGYAQFQLSIPSANLAEAMARLSRLHGAQVGSRTDSTQDVNDQYGALTRRLSDARALRTALLKQLGSTSDPQRVASLKAQLADADASVGRAQSALSALNHQINYTQISLNLSADAKPAAGGFTIGRAAHDAGRVLTVAAGVALIALAALVPLALIGAVLWWAGAVFRRRRREQALDLA